MSHPISAPIAYGIIAYPYGAPFETPSEDLGSPLMKGHNRRARRNTSDNHRCGVRGLLVSHCAAIVVDGRITWVG